MAWRKSYYELKLGWRNNKDADSRFTDPVLDACIRSGAYFAPSYSYTVRIVYFRLFLFDFTV